MQEREAPPQSSASIVHDSSIVGVTGVQARMLLPLPDSLHHFLHHLITGTTGTSTPRKPSPAWLTQRILSYFDSQDPPYTLQDVCRPTFHFFPAQSLSHLFFPVSSGFQSCLLLHGSNVVHRRIYVYGCCRVAANNTLYLHCCHAVTLFSAPHLTHVCYAQCRGYCEVIVRLLCMMVRLF